MFAVVKSGSNQFKVSADDKIIVENLNIEVGKKVKFETLLATNEKGETLIGAPNLENVEVEGEVTKNFKDKKIIIFKKRRRQNSRRKNGHRQHKSEVKITKISVK